MVKRISFLLLLVALCASFLSAQDYQKGVVIVSKVSGSATVTMGAGSPAKLKKGYRIYEGATIETAANGQVSLVFSNGSSLVVDENSKVTVEKFQVVPYQASEIDDLSDLDFEPSLSQTKLKVDKGNLVGNVKKLNYDKGSFYEIESPIGTAGIRGTSWTLTIVVDVQLGVSGAFGISEGGAVFVDLKGVQSNVGAKAVVTVSGTVDAEGNVVITSVEARPMTEAEADTVNDQVSELVEMVGDTDTGKLNKDARDSGEKGKDEDPVIVEPQIRLTATEGETVPIVDPPPRVTDTSGEGSTTDAPDIDTN